MASQVPPSKRPVKAEDRPAPPTRESEKPEDYKNTFRVSRQSLVWSKGVVFLMNPN
jgi:hypothetical protein